MDEQLLAQLTRVADGLEALLALQLAAKEERSQHDALYDEWHRLKDAYKGAQKLYLEATGEEEHRQAYLEAKAELEIWEDEHPDFDY